MNKINPLLKLLINDGIPNQELIDYKIDCIFESMVLGCINKKSFRQAIDRTNEALLDIDMPLQIKGGEENTLSLFVRRDKYDQLLERFNSSLKRHEPYLQLDNFNPETVKYDHTDDDKYYKVNFHIKLELTKEMKQSFLLFEELENDSNNNTLRKLKI